MKKAKRIKTSKSIPTSSGDPILDFILPMLEGISTEIQGYCKSIRDVREVESGKKKTLDGLYLKAPGPGIRTQSRAEGHADTS